MGLKTPIFRGFIKADLFSGPFIHGVAAQAGIGATAMDRRAADRRQVEQRRAMLVRHIAVPGVAQFLQARRQLRQHPRVPPRAPEARAPRSPVLLAARLCSTPCL